MGFDLRLPIAGLFSVLGIVLTGYGLVSGSAIYERSLGLNVNLGWGVVMIAFGLGMFAWSRLDKPKLDKQ